MSAWEEIASTYVESIANALPLHRLVIAASAILAALAVSHQTHLSIAETVVSIEVAQLIDLNSDAFQKLKILDICFGILLPILAWLTSRISTRILFLVVKRGADLENKSIAAMRKFPNIKEMELKERRDEIEILDKSLEKVRSKLKKINSSAEIFCGLGLLLLISFKWGNILDLSLGLLSLMGGIVSCGVALKIFFSEYYGTALFIVQLQGKALPTPP
jgi:hypothetical protein